MGATTLSFDVDHVFVSLYVERVMSARCPSWRRNKQGMLQLRCDSVVQLFKIQRKHSKHNRKLRLHNKADMYNTHGKDNATYEQACVTNRGINQLYCVCLALRLLFSAS